MDPLPRNLSLVVWRRDYMSIGKTKRIKTICEVLRTLARDAEERGDVVSLSRIEEAHDMAKRMQAKLEWYAGKHRGSVYLVELNGEKRWLTKREYMLKEQEGKGKHRRTKSEHRVEKVRSRHARKREHAEGELQRDQDLQGDGRGD